MDTLHCIVGVPRSGSTLLCNLLNQNDDLHATDTSPLPDLVGAVSQALSNSAEIQGLLATDDALTKTRIAGLLQAFVEQWHDVHTEPVVFDKSRAWASLGLLAADLYPDLRFIICVRDLRNVFASIEKQHRKTPYFDRGSNPLERTIVGRAGIMMANDGLIGSSVVASLDLMARMPDRCHVINHEALTRDPATALGELYDHCKLEPYTHDFDDVRNVTAEPDHLFLDKFPHHGDGPVTKTNRDEWTDYLTAELAAQIHGTYPGYNQTFGYH